MQDKMKSLTAWINEGFFNNVGASFASMLSSRVKILPHDNMFWGKDWDKIYVAKFESEYLILTNHKSHTVTKFNLKKGDIWSKLINLDKKYNLSLKYEPSSGGQGLWCDLSVRIDGYSCMYIKLDSRGKFVNISFPYKQELLDYKDIRRKSHGCITSDGEMFDIDLAIEISGYEK